MEELNDFIESNGCDNLIYHFESLHLKIKKALQDDIQEEKREASPLSISKIEPKESFTQEDRKV